MDGLFDNDGFFIHKKQSIKNIAVKVKRKPKFKENYNYSNLEMVDIEDQEKKKIPNLRTQKSNEIYNLKDTSIINGFVICNIERTLEVKKITKKDDFGYVYNYFDRIYTYCFDLTHRDKLIEYFEIIAKSVPELRKKVKELLI